MTAPVIVETSVQQVACTVTASAPDTYVVDATPQTISYEVSVANVPGPQGQRGPAGLVMRGQWDAGTAYAVDDAVFYQGSSWWAVQANTGTAPATGSADWELLAQSGAVQTVAAKDSTVAVDNTDPTNPKISVPAGVFDAYGAAAAAQAAAEAASVPTTRQVNGHPLSADVTLAAADVGAVPTTRQVNGHALSADVTLGSSDVGAVPTTRKINGYDLTADRTLAAADVGAVPTTRQVNGHALSADVTLAAADVGAVPTTRTVNGHALSANVTVTAADVAATPYALATGATAVRIIGSGATLPSGASSGDVFFKTS